MATNTDDVVETPLTLISTSFKRVLSQNFTPDYKRLTLKWRGLQLLRPEVGHLSAFNVIAYICDAHSLLDVDVEKLDLGKVANLIQDDIDQIKAQQNLGFEKQHLQSDRRNLLELSVQSEAVSPKADGELHNVPVLSEKQYLILEQMHEMGALTPDNRATGSAIANGCDGPLADVNVFKPLLSELKTRGLVDSKTGRGGGSWLTEKGSNVAATLKLNRGVNGSKR